MRYGLLMKEAADAVAAMRRNNRSFRVGLRVTSCESDTPGNEEVELAVEGFVHRLHVLGVQTGNLHACDVGLLQKGVWHERERVETDCGRANLLFVVRWSLAEFYLLCLAIVEFFFNVPMRNRTSISASAGLHSIR